MSYVAPWLIVTALAVALSWLGVRDVVRGAISDRSAPEPSSGPVIHASPSVPGSVGTPAARNGLGDDQSASGTLSPSPSPSPSKDRDKDDHDGGGGTRHGEVRSFNTRGGEAVLALSGRRGVRLVSATPDPGYETRVSGNEGWLRVDFTDDDRSSSVIASWHDHDTIVKIYEYGGNRS